MASKSGSNTAEAMPAAEPSLAPGTLGEWLQYLGAHMQEPTWLPVWPPDAFALGAAFLRRTGAYVELVNPCKEEDDLPVLPRETIERAGTAWREDLAAVFKGESGGRTMRAVCPSVIAKAWGTFRAHGNEPIENARADLSLTAAAVTLCTVSDQACQGLGVYMDQDFLAIAEQLAESNERHSYCWEISPAKLAVLGKQHTPQRGCSIRSLTHNLALYTPTEIRAVWPAPVDKINENIDVFNVLLLPWPTEVSDAAFSTAPARGVFRYFDYQPGNGSADTVDRVQRALDHAGRFVNHVHAVVLPELALSESEFTAVEPLVAGRGAMLVSGVRKCGCEDTGGMPANTCAIQPFGLTTLYDPRKKVKPADLERFRRIQFKHHRWCLDRGQIIQYSLGGRLPASRDCWELHYIGEREINFITLTRWLTISTLICEDLARQEPVTEVVRAVGPNLIFALLMDGPQLKSRWSSRYASVLAEDPGCSVLSLTSLGMSRRSQGGTPGNDRSHTIALWRDPIYGERELSLNNGDDACVLSLVCKTNEEFTIDGRGDGRSAHFPVFSNCASFAIPAAPPPARGRGSRAGGKLQ